MCRILVAVTVLSIPTEPVLPIPSMALEGKRPRKPNPNFPPEVTLGRQKASNFARWPRLRRHTCFAGGAHDLLIGGIGVAGATRAGDCAGPGLPEDEEPVLHRLRLFVRSGSLPFPFPEFLSSRFSVLSMEQRLWLWSKEHRSGWVGELRWFTTSLVLVRLSDLSRSTREEPVFSVVFSPVESDGLSVNSMCCFCDSETTCVTRVNVRSRAFRDTCGAFVLYHRLPGSTKLHNLINKLKKWIKILEAKTKLLPK